MTLNPGVSVGTIIWVIRELTSPSSPSSSVLHITIAKSALIPFEVITLCPLITHSSPSFLAVVCIDLGSDPALSGLIMQDLTQDLYKLLPKRKETNGLLTGIKL